MIIRIILFSVLLVITHPLMSIAQEKLIIPKGNVLAFNKQTRQKDGNPGKNYWQNTSDYYIRASIDVKDKIVSGREKIIYYNNSPDSLTTIVIRLYQDIFRKGVNRNSIADVNPLDIHDGVNIKSILADNTEIDPDTVKRKGTLMFIPLKEGLAPHSRIEIQIA